MDIHDAYAFCRSINVNHYENFPVASKLLPKRVRLAIDAIYAFARTADDFADEAKFDGKRLEYLQDWENQLRDSGSQNPIFIALHDAIEKFQIPIELLTRLLTAYRMDVQNNRHKNFEDLLHYCQFSANPVGRLVLWLFGYRDEQVFQLSDWICTGLQLANFWQDVAVDLKKNRIYLPLEDLKAFSVTERELFHYECTPNFKKLLKHQIDKTQNLFDDGAELGVHLKGRLKLEIGLTRRAGIHILKKIQLQDYDVLQNRPQLKKSDFAKLFLQTLFSGGF